ncbi:type I polyketide synthase [Flavobacterium algoritolerans]|uniref:Beta-ketoacyl synthase N-terminal-like domain-containing protein n=1 Tax=Flavobacterium algoritolerans TaxID=3041254 RepID=A0ABT6VCN4_9FLAO|nr:type I polyketide synthase [Flavobacterium algoritolerans]MDI5895995.1 beta-ketoacyl synthase N-terminal-like domain-containing protein [Flavobacterium algoritolerans]
MKNNQYSGFEIAVVGMSIRTSGAANWREFWNNLVLSKESLRFLNVKELIDAGMDQAVINDKNYVNCTTDLINKECFDSKFFGYSNDEAKMMYPGHRFFHECVWEALEDAGYIPENINEPVGIYAGAGEDIIWKSFVNLSSENQKVNNFFLNTINNKDYLSTLVSYKLGLKGPSMAINTACSTSLVAIHTACKALIFGETRMALAGASSLVTASEKGYIYEEGSIVSKDGHCRAFDKDSTGTVNGEGTGVVVLKRLKDAIEDKDNIYAIIKGSAVNNDGNKKVGFTAPSIEGQVACIKMAQKFSKVEPDSISYVETHGTGTKLGDSIEIEALNIAFNNNKEFSCPIGSVKTNIGHLDTASGVAGFIKTVLSIKNKKIPASLHFNESDPNINFQDGPFYVNNKLSEWESKDLSPLRAAVNSFGVGGTNAHLIVEEAPAIQKNLDENEHNLLVLSAKTPTSLRSYFDKLIKFIATEEDLNVSDMCYTFQTARQNFENRIAISFKNKIDLQQKLEQIVISQKTFEKVRNVQNSVVFVFPGQGSQYKNMGLDLYKSNSEFREYLDNGFLYLSKITNIDFKEILFSQDSESNASDINLTSNAQPFIFLIEYALAKLIMNYGIVPSYMIGHSIGEYAAACISGLFTFEQALKLVVKRGELMGALPKGSMISVSIDELTAQKFLSDKISLAAINGPSQVVFSGNDEAIEKLIIRLTESDLQYIKLYTSHAFHSAMQDSILEKFENEFSDFKFNKIQIPFVSNITGEIISIDEATSSKYWTSQLRNTVMFSKGISNLLLEDNVVFIEVGAGSSLSGLIKQHKSDKKIKTVSILKSAKSLENDASFFLENLGRMWEYGLNLNWKKVYSNEKRRKISLPTYAFDQTKFIAEIDHHKMFNAGNQIAINNLEDSFYFPSWKRSMLNINTAKELKNRIFLVFSDNSDFTRAIIDEMQEKGNTIIQVLVGTNYFQHSSVLFSIDPLRTEQYDQLFRNLEIEGLLISDVMYLWSLNLDSQTIALADEDLEFNLTYFAVGRILKSWKNGIDRNIFLFTNSLYSVLGNEKVNYGHSLVLGFLKTIPLENQIPAVNIDVISENWDQILVKNLISEVLSIGSDSDRIVAFRLEHRWVQEFQRSLQRTNENEQQVIKNKGSYLITGGLGKMGFVLAKHLINKYGANIILAGRTDLSTTVDNESASLKRFKELKKLNPSTTYISTDVSCLKNFTTAISQNNDLIDGLDGIIHLSRGDDNDLDLIDYLSSDKTISMLAPKVNGIENLYTAFKDKSLDFIWTASSLSATYGTMGLSAYISSNTYLEYFALSKSGNLKCVELPAINFDEDFPLRKQNVLCSSEVIEVFEKTLELQNSNIIYVSKEDINLTLNLFNKTSHKLGKEIKPNAEKTERPDLQTDYLSAQTDVEKKLKLIFEDFFEIIDIGVQDDFFELGGDSLRAMVFLKKINKEFNIEISISDFFSNKNIQGIANLIEEKNWLNSSINMKNEITI